MILLAQPFDPDEPEGSTTSSQYLTKRDFRGLIVAAIILLVLLTPIYMIMKRQAEQHLCAQNINAIGKAIGLYMEENNDRFPPAFAGYGDKVMLFDGHPNTWVSVVQGYMGARASFKCPSASSEENSVSEYEPGRPVKSSYGIYAPRAGALSTFIANPSIAVLIAETSNHGAKDTYNPMPLLSIDGAEVLQDGFLIGTNDSNIHPERSSYAATRLAFPNTKDGKFTQDGATRHPSGTFVLFADMHSGLIRPPAALIETRQDQVVGSWAVR